MPGVQQPSAHKLSLTYVLQTGTMALVAFSSGQVVSPCTMLHLGTWSSGGRGTLSMQCHSQVHRLQQRGVLTMLHCNWAVGKSNSGRWVLVPAHPQLKPNTFGPLQETLLTLVFYSWRGTKGNTILSLNSSEVLFRYLQEFGSDPHLQPLLSFCSTHTSLSIP